MRIESSVELQISECLVATDFYHLKGGGMFLLPLSRMEEDKATARSDSFLFRLSVQNLLFNHWPRRGEGLWCYSEQGNTTETLFYSKQGKFPKNRAGLMVFTGSQNLTHIQWDC